MLVYHKTVVFHVFCALVITRVILIKVETSLLKVYVVGEDGILEELRLAGFECLGGPVR
jgi:ribonucleotide monophosphatase NagD (HAD superfamily)